MFPFQMDHLEIKPQNRKETGVFGKDTGRVWCGRWGTFSFYLRRGESRPLTSLGKGNKGQQAEDTCIWRSHTGSAVLHDNLKVNIYLFIIYVTVSACMP